MPAISTPRWIYKCGRREFRRSSAFNELASDYQALDVAGALVDLADPDVAVDALDRKIGEVA
jgi:hypothetical protein